MQDPSRLVHRIERDFADPRLEFPGLAFHPLSEWDRVHPPAGPTPVGALDGGEGDLVAISGGHSFRVDGDLDDERAAVEVAGNLQDDAIDRLGAPWPILPLPDGREAVLEPQLGPDGTGVWAAAGHRFPIGELPHRTVENEVPGSTPA